MKKDILILGSKKHPRDNAIYDLRKTEDTIFLDYSIYAETWHYQGALAYSLRDTKDGFIFIDHVSGKNLSLDYSQAQALRALLKLTDRDSSDTFNLYKKEKSK